jgi:predicted Zn-dependent protease
MAGDGLVAQTTQGGDSLSLLMQCARAAEQVAEVPCRKVLDEQVLESGIRMPAEPSLYLRLGRLLAERGRTDETTKLYRAGVREIPNNSELPYLLAKSLLDADACLEAYGPALEALKRGSKKVELQILLGRIELCRGAADDAQQYFRSARDQGAGFEAYEGLGLALAAKGAHQAALAQFETARKLRPEERTLQLFAGRSLLALGRFSAAATMFDGVLSDPALRADGYCGLAIAFHGLGETAKAKTACERASEPSRHRRQPCSCSGEGSRR